MAYTFGLTSRNRLGTVDPMLAKVCERAIQITSCDFSILEGARSQERQYELFAYGRSVDDLRRAGVPMRVLAQPGKAKVTWTLKSRHFPDSKTGLANAVDVVPFPVVWNDKKKFLAIKDAMFTAAKELGVTLRWGGDWDCDGIACEKGETDIGHFEIKR